MSDTEKEVPRAEEMFSGEPVALDDNVPRDTVYYYSRERRLSRASPAVQKMNDGKPIRPSLSKTLFATRAHKLLFFAIILCCLTFSLAFRFSAREKGVELGGNTLALSIIPIEEMMVLGIVKGMPKSGEVYIGPVDIAVSPMMPKPKEGEGREDSGAAAPAPVFAHRIFFNPVESETYSLSLPFEGNDFLVILKTDTENKSLRLRSVAAKGSKK